MISNEQFKAHLATLGSIGAKVKATQARLTEAATALGQDPQNPELWRTICAEKARLLAYARFQ